MCHGGGGGESAPSFAKRELTVGRGTETTEGIKGIAESVEGLFDGAFQNFSR